MVEMAEMAEMAEIPVNGNYSFSLVSQVWRMAHSNTRVCNRSQWQIQGGSLG